MTLHQTKLVALIAFITHHFGVRWCCGLRKRPKTMRVWAVAVAVTLLSMLGAWLYLPPTMCWWGVAIAFVVGHFAWGSFYAWKILTQPTRTLDGWKDCDMASTQHALPQG